MLKIIYLILLFSCGALKTVFSCSISKSLFSSSTVPQASFHPRGGLDGRAMNAVTCPTPGCNRKYYWRNSLARHLREECGLEPRFQCPQCPYRTKQKAPMLRHIRIKHKDPYSEPCFVTQ